MVRDAIRKCFNYEQLRSLGVESGAGNDIARAYPELEMMISLMYGLHIISAGEAGEDPGLVFGELNKISYPLAVNRARKWIDPARTDQTFKDDLRDCLPVGETKAGLRQFAIYLCTFGARLSLVEIDIEDDAGGNEPSSTIYVTAKPMRDTVKIRRRLPPLSRKQFRRICDSHKNRPAIIKSMVHGGANMSFFRSNSVKLGFGLIIAALIFLWTQQLRSRIH